MNDSFDFSPFFICELRITPRPFSYFSNPGARVALTIPPYRLEDLSTTAAMHIGVEKG